MKQLEEGLFFAPPTRKTRADTNSDYQRPLAPIPATDWHMPVEFPNLSAAKRIALDTETRDPELKTHGPGWGRGNGEVVGVSLAVDEGHSWYFPIGHENGENLNSDKVLAYLRDTLGNSQPKIGANLLYDVGWLAEHDVKVNGLLLDVQYAEALLDDWALAYNLEALGQHYFGEGKESSRLYDWLALSFGGAATAQAQGNNIWRAPASLVGPYAEQDALLPLRIIDKQWSLLEQQGLTELFLLECRLIPLLYEMRRQGVRVNVAKAEQVMEQLAAKQQEHMDILEAYTGRIVQIYAAEDIAIAFDNAGIKYPFTKTGKPSFTQTWLQNHPSRIAQEIVAARKLDKARSTFVEGFILGMHVNGRVHCQFHPLRGDDGGAVSGRFSSSSPNLQQIPSRDPELGPLIRGLFIPEDWHPSWDKIDYSQIEYRYLAHFATGRGADKVRELYRNDPRTDYHAATTELVRGHTGIELPRAHTKNVNFGLCIAEDSPVLTHRGEVPIQDVQDDDLLWDGIEWVEHAGVLYQGQRQVIKYCGLVATPGHYIAVQQQGKHWWVPMWRALSRGMIPVPTFSYGAVRQTAWDGDSALIDKIEDAKEASGFTRVYDILDAGPRHRFTCNGLLVANCYGMGEPKLCNMLGISRNEGTKLFKAYHAGVPFTKATYTACEEQAQNDGYITTILGRRSRFTRWEKKGRRKGASAMTREQALELYPPNELQRFGTHKALNRRLQGSAADLMKKAMVDAYEAGIFDATGIPLLTVHDELDFSNKGTKEYEEGRKELIHCMETAIPCNVPIIADCDSGPDWGHVK